jgi:hypothetical protein
MPSAFPIIYALLTCWIEVPFFPAENAESYAVYVDDIEAVSRFVEFTTNDEGSIFVVLEAKVPCNHKTYEICIQARRGEETNMSDCTPVYPVASLDFDDDGVVGLTDIGVCHRRFGECYGRWQVEKCGGGE